MKEILKSIYDNTISPDCEISVFYYIVGIAFLFILATTI